MTGYIDLPSYAPFFVLSYLIFNHQKIRSLCFPQSLFHENMMSNPGGHLKTGFFNIMPGAFGSGGRVVKV